VHDCNCYGANAQGYLRRSIADHYLDAAVRARREELILKIADFVRDLRAVDPERQ
jgi:hypothetical protein